MELKEFCHKKRLINLLKEEEAKIDAGTSPLTNPEMSSGGMGLGGVYYLQ